MPANSSQITADRSRGHARSDSETRPITEARLSSFTNGEGTTSGNEWAMLDDATGGAARKRVMIVVDHSREARLAMLWALSHLVQREDSVALIQVMPPQKNSTRHSQVKEPRTKLHSKASELGLSLQMLCTSRKPEVCTEVLLVEGTDKGPTIVSQAKKLEASVLVMGQRKPTLFQRLLQRNNDALVDYCIENAECLTLAVRKKSKQAGGYLINSKWQKNFWLLA